MSFIHRLYSHGICCSRILLSSQQLMYSNIQFNCMFSSSSLCSSGKSHRIFRSFNYSKKKPWLWLYAKKMKPLQLCNHNFYHSRRNYRHIRRRRHHHHHRCYEQFMKFRKTPLIHIDPTGGDPTVTQQQRGLSLESEKIDRRVWPIAASSLLMGTAMGIVLPIMPLFARSLGLSSQDYGLVISVMGLTRLMFNIPASWAAEKFGRRPVLAGGPLFSAAGMTLTVTATTLNELMAYRFLVGGGGSLQMSAAQLYLSDISSSNNRARTMAPMLAAFSAGSTLGPAIGGFVVERFGMYMPFYVVGAAVFSVAINNWVMCPETKPPVDINLKQYTLLDEFKKTLISWRIVAKNRDMKAILGCHTAYWLVSSGCIFTLMPLVATDTFQLSAGQLGGCFAMVSAINVIGSQPVAYLADKLGRKYSIVPATALLSLSAALLPHATTIPEFTASMVLWAVGSTCLGTTPTAYTADIMPNELRPAALGLLRSGGDVGLMLGALIMGTLAHTFSVDVAMHTGSAMVAIAGANFAWRAKETIKRR